MHLPGLFRATFPIFGVALGFLVVYGIAAVTHDLEGPLETGRPEYQCNASDKLHQLPNDIRSVIPIDADLRRSCCKHDRGTELCNSGEGQENPHGLKSHVLQISFAERTDGILGVTSR